MSRTLSLPIPSTFDCDIGAVSDSDVQPKSPHPHLRAQLGSIHRQYKPPESYEPESELDDSNRITSSFVQQVVRLLEEEREDDLKALLKDNYRMDDDALEQNVLDLMHKHRDDVAGVPFLFLTPTRRPISRPSSRSSSHSIRLRPETPTSAPSSPLSFAFRRPHTPLTSPLASGIAQPSSYMSARSASPHSSPVLAHAQGTYPNAQFTASLPSSPLSSPRLLNAKASEFKPIQRPLSAASSNPASLTTLRSDTPSPDLWAPTSLRTSSNLAIAAPLVADQSLSPPRTTTASSLRSSLRPGDDDDDEDPFDPFASKSIPRSFHSFTVTDFDSQWSNSSNSNSSRSPEEFRPLDQSFNPETHTTIMEDSTDIDGEASAMLTDGMTPFDVLSSVFGSTLAPSELEDALAANGYEFERAMAWLVDRALPTTPNAHIRTQNLGSRVTLISRDINSVRGGKPGYENSSTPGRTARYANGRPTQGGNRVCRYFIAGECLRADCRFSHDLERALCRFWLRGTCAKQDSCEFLHHLPKNVDISGLTAAMSHANIGPVPPSPPPDEFPSLDTSAGGRGRRGSYGRDDMTHHDPGRTRFASAVKKPAVASPALNSPTHGQDPTLAARREAMGNSGESLHHRSAIVAPRPSPRLKLRSPSLLPSLPTGESVNKLYMSYRSRALQLGAARNACLSRAADAWRRGDGAAAKRFSREGHDLNAKMSAEMTEAAGNLVRERARVAEQAVRARDLGWSDDPGDRTSRGRVCGDGLGVCLGIARKDVGEEKNLTPEERTEAMLDLHGLHSNEANEVLEEYLIALEREHFYGLAYIVVGEEKHRGKFARSMRLATGVREWLHRWGYPWNERDGVICVDALTHT